VLRAHAAMAIARVDERVMSKVGSAVMVVMA
jgi:hypothetical protein